MSRTFRRKNTDWNARWALSELVRSTGIRWYWKPLDRNSKEYAKKKAEYHSDAGFGDYGHATAPRWYRRLLNKSCVMREKQEINRFLRSPDYEVPKPRRVSDAGWYW